ncbi:MAG: hypothetical protein P1U87_01475 [Verrucomicrobiales bacterium]|nr:hypothetical protein [Verrucomicrobiales bacterium]
MKRILTASCFTAFFLTTLLRSEESGFDDPSEKRGASGEPGSGKLMDEVLRPDVFARYERLPELEDRGNGLYRALYRIPESVYGSGYFHELPEVKEWLEGEGVEFGKGSSVAFDAGSRILEVVQTVPQLTRAELFLARFGGMQEIQLDLDIFELPLLEGWELVGNATGLVDHSSIRKEVLTMIRKGEGRIVESFSSLLKSGSRGKLERSGRKVALEVGAEADTTRFEFDVLSGPTGISGGTESQIHVNFSYRRPGGEFEPRNVVQQSILPHQGSVIAASWKEGDSLQILFLSAGVRTVNGVTRVRRVTEDPK